MSGKVNAKINTFWNRLRVQNGMSVKDVAEYLEVSYPTVNKWLSGRVKMPRDAVKKLADLFDISENEALAETKRMERTYCHGDGRQRKVIDVNTDNNESKVSEDISDTLRTIFFTAINLNSDPVKTGEAYEDAVSYLLSSKDLVRNYISENPNSEYTNQATSVLTAVDRALVKYNVVTIPLDEENLTEFRTYSVDSVEGSNESASCESDTTSIVEKVLDIVYGKVTRSEYNLIVDLLYNRSDFKEAFKHT